MMKLTKEQNERFERIVKNPEEMISVKGIDWMVISELAEDDEKWGNLLEEENEYVVIVKNSGTIENPIFNLCTFGREDVELSEEELKELLSEGLIVDTEEALKFLEENNVYENLFGEEDEDCEEEMEENEVKDTFKLELVPRGTGLRKTFYGNVPESIYYQLVDMQITGQDEDIIQKAIAEKNGYTIEQVYEEFNCFEDFEMRDDISQLTNEEAIKVITDDLEHEYKVIWS